MKQIFRQMKLILFFFSFCLVSLPLWAIQDSTNIIHTQEIYKTVDTLNLKVDVFYSEEMMNEINNTAIVFFHGGGWAFGSPNEFFTTCERYAKMGIVCFSVDYRLSIDNGIVPHKKISPIESLMDAKSAMRWVRKNANRFKINKDKIVAAGQSAGGHLAISTAIIENFNDKSDDLNISCKPNAVLMFSGTVNTVESWCDHLLGKRRSEIWNISPFHNLKSKLPPTAQFHGIDDDIVPLWTIAFFQRDTEKLGNYFELNKYEGRKHYLGEGNPKYSRYFDDDILNTADKFLRKFDLLPPSCNK